MPKLSRSGFRLDSPRSAMARSLMGRPQPVRPMVWPLTSRLMLSPTRTSYPLAQLTGTPARKLRRRHATKCSSARRTAETVAVALEDTSETIQAFEAPTFADYEARTPVERDLVHRRHRHCGACVVPSLLSEFSRVSTDRVKRDKRHCELVAAQLGLPCGRKPSDGRHLWAIAGARGKRMNS